MNTETRSSSVAERIWSECEERCIQCDKNQIPIKLTADCYIFYGTPITWDCRTQGKCKEMRFYALTGGKRVTILEYV